MPATGKIEMNKPVRRMNSANRRMEIINAAFLRTAEVGHPTLSTTELANMVGISQPAIFRHFRSKDQLHAAILDEANMRIINAFKARIGQSELWSRPLDLLVDIVTSLAEHFVQSPGIWLTVMCERNLIGNKEPIRDATSQSISAKSASHQLQYTFERLCKASIEAGHLKRSTQPAELGGILVGLIFGIGQQWLNDGMAFDLSGRLIYATCAMLDGFRTGQYEGRIGLSAIA